MDGHAFPSKVEDLITKPFPPRHAMRIKRKAQRTLLSPLRHARAVMAPEYNSAKCFPRNFNEISGGISPSLLSSPFKTSLIQARSIAARFPPFVPICRLDSFLRELLSLVAIRVFYLIERIGFWRGRVLILRSRRKAIKVKVKVNKEGRERVTHAPVRINSILHRG